MAGVSLVADAAEELERNTINPGMLCNVDARTLTSSSDKLSTVDGIAPSSFIFVLVITELCFTPSLKLTVADAGFYRLDVFILHWQASAQTI